MAIRLLNNNGLTFLSLLLMFSHLLVAHNCSGQRFSRLWWYDLKSNGSSALHPFHHQLNPDHQATSWLDTGSSYNIETDDMDGDDVDRQQKANILNSLQQMVVNDNFLTTNAQRPPPTDPGSSAMNPDGYYYGPSDDELMTQASKLSSHMTRIMAPVSQSAGKQPLRSQYEPVSGSLDSLSSPTATTTTSTTFDDVISNGEQLFQMPTTTVQPANTRKQQLQQQAATLKKIVDQVLLPKPAATNARPFFTSQPFGQAASPSSFRGNFLSQPQQRRNADQINNYSDRIWNFFDSSVSRGGGSGGNNQRIPSWKTFASGNGGMSNGGTFEDDGGFNSVVDSYIEKLKKRQSQQLKAKNEKLKNSKGVSAGKSKKDQDNKNVLSLNLNRRKNTEEKEKFRKLIQNIFDSTPRKTYSYGAENGYSKIGATTTADDMANSGEMMVDQQENEPPNSSEEDVLKNEKEENVLLKDNTDADADNNNNNNDDLVDKIAATNDDGLDDLDREERAGDTDNVQGKEIEDDGVNAGAVGTVDDGDELLNQAERPLNQRDTVDETAALDDGSPASETDLPDAMEDLGQNQENQYLKHRPNRHSLAKQRSTTSVQGKRKKSSFFRTPSQFATSQRSSAAAAAAALHPNHRHPHPKSAVWMLATTTTTTTESSHGFGLTDDDVTTVSPLFTMTPLSATGGDNGNTDEESLNLSNEHLFAGFGESFPVDNGNNNGSEPATTPATTTTTTTTTITATGIDPELKSKLITKRKQQTMGKWLDAETFDLRNDHDDDDDAVAAANGGDVNGANGSVDVSGDGRDKAAISTSSSGSASSSSSSSSSSSVLQTTNHRRSAALQIDFQPLVRSRTMPALSPRIIRQNSRLQLANNNLNNDDDGDIAQLSRTLSGVPGQDYPVLGSIPRTRFSCHDHKWPGYYADVDTQCQVFHICQIGNRKASFLCPNGTMFNQQLFVCDWWHNVQCDEVPNHYELNAHIYDHNWESARLTTGAVSGPKSQRISIRRMAVLEDGAAQAAQAAPSSSAVEMAETANNTETESGFQSPATTTAIPLSINLTTTIQPVMITTTTTTTTESAPSSLTESVFGARRSINSDHQSLDNSWKPMVEHEDRPKRKIVPGTKGGSSSNSGNSGDLSKFSKLIQANKQANKQQQNHFGTTFGQWNSSNKLSGSSTASNHRHKFASLAAKSTPLPQLFAQNVRQQPSVSASASSLQQQRLPMTPASVHMSTRPGKYYRT